MIKPKSKSNRGGARPGAGRNTERKVDSVSKFYLFEDQTAPHKPPPDKVRRYYDIADQCVAAIGHPDFDAGVVQDALKEAITTQYADNQPSIIALMNMLSAIDSEAKAVWGV